MPHSPSEQISSRSPALTSTSSQVGLVVRLAVEDLEDQRAVRVLEGLGLGDPAVVDEGLHPGVVAGEPGEVAVAVAGRRGSRRCWRRRAGCRRT